MLKLPLYRLLKVAPLIGIVLTGCTLNRPATTPNAVATSTSWQQHQKQLSAITHYQIQGAFAYHTSKQNIYARFNWRQTSANNYRLLLINPLGNIELQLDVLGDRVQLVNRLGERFIGQDAQQVISQLAGMDIPLTNLRQWILGLPGHANKITLNEQQLLRSAEYTHNDQQWQITINDYKTTQTLSLPARIELFTEKTRIKLRIDNWIL